MKLIFQPIFIISILFLILSTYFFPSLVISETIISKKDADHIFSLKKSEWEVYKNRYVFPEGWEVRFNEINTGTGIIAYDNVNNMGLSVQPLYEDDNSFPDLVIVGSYYEKGRFDFFNQEFISDVKKEAEKDLGSKYVVDVKYVRPSEKYEGVEITLMIKK